MDCVNCDGIMIKGQFSWDVQWYKCSKCHIIEGSDGTIVMSKMEKPLTNSQIKEHRKKWEI